MSASVLDRNIVLAVYTTRQYILSVPRLDMGNRVRYHTGVYLQDKLVTESGYERVSGFFSGFLKSNFKNASYINNKGPSPETCGTPYHANSKEFFHCLNK